MTRRRPFDLNDCGCSLGKLLLLIKLHLDLSKVLEKSLFSRTLIRLFGIKDNLGFTGLPFNTLKVTELLLQRQGKLQVR